MFGRIRDIYMIYSSEAVEHSLKLIYMKYFLIYSEQSALGYNGIQKFGVHKI